MLVLFKYGILVTRNSACYTRLISSSCGGLLVRAFGPNFGWLGTVSYVKAVWPTEVTHKILTQSGFIWLSYSGSSGSGTCLHKGHMHMATCMWCTWFEHVHAKEGPRDAGKQVLHATVVQSGMPEEGSPNRKSIWGPRGKKIISDFGLRMLRHIFCASFVKF